MTHTTARFTVTYDIVTSESAEDGDVAEAGFVCPGGWRFGADEDADVAVTLRDALRLVGCVEDSGTWFTETDGREDYRTGAVERRALHPPRNITPSSYARIARLLRAY